MFRRLLPYLLSLTFSLAGAEAVQRISFYQAQQYQTGPRPSMSACGPTRAPWKQVAVSRDLLKRFPCGTLVRVTLKRPTHGTTSFLAVVYDVTNRRYRRTVDILVGQHEPARRYGITVGSIVAVR